MDLLVGVIKPLVFAVLLAAFVWRVAQSTIKLETRQYTQ